jgi:hypothetical protein
MTTYAKMLSTLAIGAATLVTITFTCDEALAKSGGGGGMRSSSGGTRSLSVVRTPIVVSKVRTVRTVSAPTSVHPKVSSLVTRTKIKSSNLANIEKRRLKSTRLIPVNDEGGNPGGGGTTGTPPTKQPPVIVPPKQPPVVVPPTIPPVVINQPPKQPPVVVPPTIPPVVISQPPKQPPVIVPPTIPPIVIGQPPKQPPVIVVDPAPHPHPVHPPASVSVGIGAVAPVVEADPPGCTYERSVRHTPGVGLQRVIIKVCPDA